MKNKNKALSYVSWIALLVGFCSTLAAVWVVNLHNTYQITEHTNELADDLEQLVEQRFNQFEYGLRGARGAVISPGVENVTRARFKRYADSRDIEREFPGALGFGFIRRVPVDQEADFIEQARADGAPNFNVRALTPHFDDRFIIQYIYPQQPNKEAVGLDIGSESNRRRAALAAARVGQPQLTAPITLVQADGKPRRGFLVLLPIYSTPTMPQTPEAREQAVAGWSYAPLLVDGVLQNLGPLMDQVSLTLTDPDEGSPFYQSDGENVSAEGSKAVSRSINVLGQSWEMSLAPRESMVGQLRLWSPWWAIGVGLTLTGLALWFSYQWSTKLGSVEEVGQNQDAENFRSFKHFLQSAHFRRSWPPAVLAFILVFLAAGWFIVDSRLDVERQSLIEANERAVESLNEVIASQKSNVLALASTPTVVSLMNSGSQQEKEKWRDQIANIFKAFALASPDVHQARLIEASGGWRESVRIQRSAGQLRITDVDQLQAKAMEPYIERTIALDSGEVFVSDINLNRELGAIERPYRPVWRFATPLFHEDGRVFGIVIVNLNAGKLLDSLAASVPGSVDLLITNPSGHYLLHPHANKGFAFELGNAERWQDEFTQADAGWSLSVEGLSQWHGPLGFMWARQSQIKLDDLALASGLQISTMLPQFPIYKDLSLQLIALFVGLTALAALTTAVQFLTWRMTQIRNWEALWRVKEQQNERESALFKALVDSAPDATLIVDEKGIIERANIQAQSLFGYARDELEGMSINRLMPDHLSSTHDAHIANYVKRPSRRAMGGETDLLACRADGSQFPMEVSLGPVQMEDRLLVAASVRDITQRLTAERRLRNALQEAEKATEAKTAFLANTSHEIRTPLNAVIGLAHLLGEESLSDSQHQLVKKISVAGRSLLGIVNDVLDLSKIEASEMSVEQVPVELRELLEEVGGVFLPEAESKKLRYRLEVDSRLPAWVLTDGTRLRQILVNLLGNAIKFTQIGGITLRAELINVSGGLGADQQCLRLSVQDTGIGISPEKQVKLFQPFMQADTSTTRSFGGTGLGLSIVSSLANLLGGEAGVLSQEGEGSTFFVDLPLKEASADDVLALGHQTSALLVMVVESDPEESRHLEAMTRALGWRAQMVKDRDELMQAVVKRRETGLRSPDAVISSQPIQNWESACALDTHGPGNAQEALPLVLLTSDDNHEVMGAQADQSAAIRIVRKPLDASVLFDAVNGVVTQLTGNNTRVLQSTRTETVRAQWLPGVRVLVVDDSVINLDVVSQILERNGASVETVDSGQKSLERLESGAADFDVVLMDVQMPVMDGLETTRQARNRLGLQSLPIIALTAGALLEERQRAFEAGMNDFLTKPIDPSQLINRIRISVEDYRGTALAVHPMKSLEPEKYDPFPEVPGLNTERSKQLLLGNGELFLVTLDGLLREHSNLLQPPLEDVDGQNATALRQTLAAQIHKLRNVSGLVGAEHLSKLASESEITLRAEGESAAGVLAKLAASLNQLRDSSAATLNTWHQRLAEESAAASGTRAVEPLGTEDLQRLGNLLAANDLAALDEVSRLGPSLESALGAEAFRKLQDSLARLDFRHAVELIETSDQQGEETHEFPVRT